MAARPIWKGHITFGLVNIPVTLYSAERRSDISFHMVDSRNKARIRYERVNEATGEEVPWKDIVKGYEYDDGKYVILSEEEFKKVNPEVTKTIDIEQFIDLDEIPPVYYDKPYYLVPAKHGHKGYELLRRALEDKNKIGIAKVVIRTRQYLCALMPQDGRLLLMLLRYPQELRDPVECHAPEPAKGQDKISAKELKMAEQLVESMTGEWEPDEHHDEYREELLKFIENKIESGEIDAKAAAEAEEKEIEPEENVIDLVKYLEQSVQKAKSRKSGKTSKSSKSRKAA